MIGAVIGSEADFRLSPLKWLQPYDRTFLLNQLETVHFPGETPLIHSGHGVPRKQYETLHVDGTKGVWRDDCSTTLLHCCH